MPTLLEPTYKDLIGEKLTNRLGHALRTGEIELEEAEKIITLILSVVHSMTYKEELYALLTKLSQGWPFFNDLLKEEQVTAYG